MTGTMEDQLSQLLADTQLSAEGPRKQAELHLQQAQSNPAFPGTSTLEAEISISAEFLNKDEAAYCTMTQATLLTLVFQVACLLLQVTLRLPQKSDGRLCQSCARS